jgi:hypothetical protein
VLVALVRQLLKLVDDGPGDRLVSEREMTERERVVEKLIDGVSERERWRQRSDP